MDFLEANPHKNQAGQVGVVTLLIMTVLLTIGLSTAANTTRDVNLSQQEAESTRVFTAAEAGIEEALSSYEGENITGSVGTIGDVDVDYTLTEVNALETRLFEGVSVAVDVTGTTTGQGLTINWSKDDDCGTQDPASLLVAIFYDDAGTTRARYETAGACDRSDGFTLASNINIDGYRREFDLPLQTGDLFVRIKPLYNDTHIRVVGDGWVLPVQGVRVRSEARNQLGNEARNVEVNRSLPTAPSVMDYALVSGTTIVK
jgi:hypothetical protein